MGEEERYRLFREALNDAEENYVRQGLHQGTLTGSAIFVQQWINALQFWFGGWLLFKYPDVYTFKDFTDREQVEKSLSRIFYLLDKRSEIDPLSEEGKTMNYAGLFKMVKENQNSDEDEEVDKSGSKTKDIQNE